MDITISYKDSVKQGHDDCLYLRYLASILSSNAGEKQRHMKKCHASHRMMNFQLHHCINHIKETELQICDYV